VVLAASEVFLLGAENGNDTTFVVMEANWRIEDEE
jgi:hypothetical protein